MNAKIDHDLCIGCGLCAETAPEIFELRDDKAYVKLSDIPDNLKDAAKEAMQNCPVDAISLE